MSSIVSPGGIAKLLFVDVAFLSDRFEISLCNLISRWDVSDYRLVARI